MNSESLFNPLTGPRLPVWQNVVLAENDPQVDWIRELEARARPIPEVAWAIRELITRLEVCHFKWERHVERIVAAIREMQLPLDPRTIGRAHPRCGPEAWRLDPTGRSRRAQEYIRSLEAWLAGVEKPSNPRNLTDRPTWGDTRPWVNEALGLPNPRKIRMVEALVDRLVLREGREPLPPEYGAFGEQIERTDICLDEFPRNLERMITAIGRQQPVEDFIGCGSFDETRRAQVRGHYLTLVHWLAGRETKPPSLTLGTGTPVRIWLVASLAKTLKAMVSLPDPLPHHAQPADLTEPEPVP